MPIQNESIAKFKKKHGCDMKNSLTLQAPPEMCAYIDNGIDGVPCICDFSICQN